MPARRPRALVSALLGLGLFSAATARAYVRITSERSGAPVVWLESCIPIRPDARGSVDVSLEEIEATLARAADNWNLLTVQCGSFLHLVPQRANGVADVGVDGQPIVVFRHDRWARPGAKIEHDPSTIGITSVFYVDRP